MTSSRRAVFAALVAAFAVGWATPAGCQGRGEQGTFKSVKAAQMTGTINGSTATLDARIWVNLMPSLGPRSPSVRIAARLFITGAHRGGIAVSRLWFVPSNGEPVEAAIASSQVTPEGVRLAGAVASTRDLGGSGWVVAEIKGSANSLFIRSAETSIQRVH